MQESKDAKAKEKLRKETLCGRLDRTINYAREIKYHIQICSIARGEDMDNIILGSTQRQREKKVCCNNKLWGQTKMQ